MKRRTDAGAHKRTVLAALGIRPDGRKEVIDFRQAPSESQCAWEGFLRHRYQRGVTGTALKLIVTDGGSGLLAVLPLVYGSIPGQRCWAHKTRNVLDSVNKSDRPAVKAALHRVSHATTLLQAQQEAGRFVHRWQSLYPTATACLVKDLPELLTFLRVRLALDSKALGTTNAGERRFRERRRRTRPMGTLSDATSIDRILWAVFTHENQKQGTATPFLLSYCHKLLDVTGPVTQDNRIEG